MKKILLIIYILLIALIINKKESVNYVFNEFSFDSNFYILEFPNQNISTNNFENYFKNIQVISIEPYINLIYQNNIKTIYKFENLEKFKDDFLNELINKNYKQDAINLKILGIKIKKIKVYSNYSTLKNIKIKNMIIKKNI